MSITSTDTKPWLTVTDVARHLGVSVRTVRQWILDGRGGKKLNAIRPGGTGMWLIAPKDLEDFFTSNKEATDT